MLLTKINILRNFFVFFLVASIMLFPRHDASALTADEMLWGGYETKFQDTIGLGGADPRDMIVSLIKVAMSFMGIIAMIMIMLAGFKFMTSGGNEDRVGEAKGMLSGAVIGIMIMLASYGIANFVINSMFQITGANVL